MHSGSAGTLHESSRGRIVHLPRIARVIKKNLFRLFVRVEIENVHIGKRKRRRDPGAHGERSEQLERHAVVSQRRKSQFAGHGPFAAVRIHVQQETLADRQFSGQHDRGRQQSEIAQVHRLPPRHYGYIRYYNMCT